MDSQSKKQFVNDAKGLAKFFSVDIVIKIFGQVIFEWHFPPSKTSDDD